MKDGLGEGSAGGSLFQPGLDSQIVIHNNEEEGVVEIFCNKDVNIIANNNAHVQAGQHLSFRAEQLIKFSAGGSLLTLGSGVLQTNTTVRADRMFAFFPELFPGPGGGSSASGGEVVDQKMKTEPPDPREPDDRAKTYNEPFEECPQEEVEHKI